MEQADTKLDLLPGGYEQVESLNFDETYSPVGKMTTFRYILSFIAQNVLSPLSSTRRLTEKSTYRFPKYMSGWNWCPDRCRGSYV